MAASEAARILNVGVSTVIRWIGAGDLHPIKKLSGARGAWLLDTDDVYALAERRITASVLGRARSTVRRSTRAAGTGWCGVPKRGACWWCLMLASRGTVYERETAISTKSGNARYHAHCRCTAAEVFSDRDLPARTKACVDYYETLGHLDRDDVESGHFIQTTGIVSTSIEERDN